MDKKTSNIAAGVGSLTIALGFRLAGRNLEGISRVFPESLELFLGAGGALLLLRGVWQPRQRTEGAEGTDLCRVVLIALTSMLYVLVIPVVGFYATSAVFLFTVSWLFAERGRGMQGLLPPAFFTVTMVFLVYLVFRYLLQVPTPEGFLL